MHYSASLNMKLVHLPLMGGLLYLVQPIVFLVNLVGNGRRPNLGGLDKAYPVELINF